MELMRKNGAHESAKASGKNEEKVECRRPRLRESDFILPKVTSLHSKQAQKQNDYRQNY